MNNPFIANDPTWVKPLWYIPELIKGCASCEHYRTAGQPNRACAERPVDLMFEMDGERDADGVYHSEDLPPIVVIAEGCSSYALRGDLVLSPETPVPDLPM